MSSAASITAHTLPPEALIRRCDATRFDFETTAALEDTDLMNAQKRAQAALDFGTEIDASGFNIFVIGSARHMMETAVRSLLTRQAAKADPAEDWVYLNNFAVPHRPLAERLPAGRAVEFRDAMRDFIEDLQVAVPAAFESEEYQARRAAIEQAFAQKQEEVFRKLQENASQKGIAVIRTPAGFTLAPVREGKVVKPEVYARLPKVEQEEIERNIEMLEQELQAGLRQIPAWDKDRRNHTRRLNQETARGAVGHLIEEIRGQFADLPRILEHLSRIEADLVDNIGFLLAQQQQQAATAGLLMPDGNPVFGRYEVNLLVTHSGEQGAPVIDEPHPTLANLVGRVEHVARQGVLATDFRLIKPGALHRANGGYLVLDARLILSEPFAWAALKRALKSGEIGIESAVDLMSMTTTITLQPDPIPLKIKVVLIGERILYYLLAAHDPEFAEHFKVLADFDDEIDRENATEDAYARLIATLVRDKGLRPLDREAVARTIDRSARMADDAGKLSLVMDLVGDLLTEADFLAGREGVSIIGARHIVGAIEQQIQRSSRVRDRMQEMILREIALVDTEGSAIGQINGLSVSQLGGHAFGRPTRITARVAPGSGRVVDIEREVELGGAIHSKGVLILSGYVSGRYALDTPISLLASLVFEQSYGGVDGDSASAAELLALLSALAELPLRQDLAITGSINQHGVIQAIGGVNEKIEGFFDICKARGLTGTQGVIIPRANAQHLMLRDDVVAAAREGRFHVHAIETIDEGLAILTGEDAEKVHERVEERLHRFALARRALAREADRGAT